MLRDFAPETTFLLGFSFRVFRLDFYVKFCLCIPGDSSFLHSYYFIDFNQFGSVFVYFKFLVPFVLVPAPIILN